MLTRSVVFFCLLICAYGQIASNCGIASFEPKPILENAITESLYPKIPNTVYGSCGPTCTYTKGFSCVNVTAVPPSVDFIECNPNVFPLCMGRIGASNDCHTMDCCKQLNAVMLGKVDIQFNSFNYIMEFRNEFGYEIPCEEFDSNTGDTCVQFADYGASSDEYACIELGSFLNNVDDMTFELF